MEEIYCADIPDDGDWCSECVDAGWCDDLEDQAHNMFDYSHTNGDEFINIGDNISDEDLAWFMDCDEDYNASVDVCEVYECVVKA
jgi:hypothetical protein